MRKPILDACCGSRMFWFDKENPLVCFADIRNESHTLTDGRILNVNPDVIQDFRQMDFPDGSFKLVVFDPPHLKKLGKTSWMAKKYGALLPTWEHDIAQGFSECLRVLEPLGVLIFKWNEDQIPTSKIIELAGQQPLFGHPSGKHSKTIWLCFMKLPK